MISEHFRHWVEQNPHGILALHYPQKFGQDLQALITQWKTQLLLLFDTILYPSLTRQLQDLRETDIIDIANEELTPAQVELLKVVLAEENFVPNLQKAVQIA